MVSKYMTAKVIKPYSKAMQEPQSQVNIPFGHFDRESFLPDQVLLPTGESFEEE